MAKPAQLLTRAIRDYLRLRGYFVWKGGTAGALNAKGQFFQICEAGSPDLFAIKDGTLLCIEVKAGKDRLSPRQEFWLSEAEKHGAVCIVARSVDDVMRVVEQECTTNE